MVRVNLTLESPPTWDSVVNMVVDLLRMATGGDGHSTLPVRSLLTFSQTNSMLWGLRFAATTSGSRVEKRESGENPEPPRDGIGNDRLYEPTGCL